MSDYKIVKKFIASNSQEEKDNNLPDNRKVAPDKNQRIVENTIASEEDKESK